MSERIPSLMLEIARAADAGIYNMGALTTIGASSQDVNALRMLGMPVMEHAGCLLITRAPVAAYTRSGARIELVARYDDRWVDSLGRSYNTRDVVLETELRRAP